VTDVCDDARARAYAALSVLICAGRRLTCTGIFPTIGGAILFSRKRWSVLRRMRAAFTSRSGVAMAAAADFAEAPLSSRYRAWWTRSSSQVLPGRSSPAHILIPRGPDRCPCWTRRRR
jgi:hypothetical protein